MSSDNATDEGLPKNPNMEHAELLYVIQNKSTAEQEKHDAKTKLMKEIVDNSEYWLVWDGR